MADITRSFTLSEDGKHVSSTESYCVYNGFQRPVDVSTTEHKLDKAAVDEVLSHHYPDKKSHLTRQLEIEKEKLADLEKEFGISLGDDSSFEGFCSLLEKDENIRFMKIINFRKRFYTFVEDQKKNLSKYSSEEQFTELFNAWSHHLNSLLTPELKEFESFLNSPDNQKFVDAMNQKAKIKQSKSRVTSLELELKDVERWAEHFRLMLAALS